MQVAPVSGKHGDLLKWEPGSLFSREYGIVSQAGESGFRDYSLYTTDHLPGVRQIVITSMHVWGSVGENGDPPYG